jgi:2-dehydro-3-deoxyphosphogluconate aldolase/(4S)-4-hydroxy-2-oxoglutarate aldolase
MISGETPMQIRDVMSRAPVIPVLTVDDAAQAVPLARALAKGGLTVLEVTLRTPAALEAVSAMVKSVPEALVGVGTVTRGRDFDDARDAGAQFVVSPGLSPALLDAAERTGMPFLPGAVTPSEIIMALDAGRSYLKFFPAEASGGVPTLKAFSGPFPDVRFCPTGGIRPENYLDYLNLNNVLCVGGTWLTPRDALASGDWDRITALAAHVAGRRSGGASRSEGDDIDIEPSVGEEDPGSANDYVFRDMESR